MNIPLKVLSAGLKASDAKQINENCGFVAFNAASSGNFLPTFRDNLSVPSIFLDSRLLQKGPIGCPETSVRN